MREREGLGPFLAFGDLPLSTVESWGFRVYIGFGYRNVEAADVVLLEVSSFVSVVSEPEHESEPYLHLEAHVQHRAAGLEQGHGIFGALQRPILGAAGGVRHIRLISPRITPPGTCSCSHLRSQ